MRKTLCTLLAMLFLFIYFTACKDDKNKLPGIAKDIDISLPKQIAPASSNQFDSAYAQLFFARYPRLNTIQQDWVDFYRERNYSFAWADSNGITGAAQNLHNRINNLSDDGLDDSLLYRQQFNRLFDEALLMGKNELKDSNFIFTEMMLSAQYFMYARQIYGALSAKELKELGWNIAPKKISYFEYLNEVLKDSSKDVFKAEPVYVQYGFLKDFLKKYKEIEMAGGWPLVDSTIKKLKPGDSSLSIPAIKRRLFISGDLTIADTTRLFDALLAEAVKKFRTRHGLSDTALIDKNTCSEMNVPVSKRIEEILINMERCRWLPYNPGPDYIIVNIPDYRLYVYENNKVQFSMKVVVGKEASKTVIFNDTLKIIAFSPYWNVPYSIYKNELKGRLSAAYLKRNNMEIVSEGRVRQLPGKNNSLGLVKFLFPNSYNIYFHDTPAKDRFNFTNRAFSHGCIRLSEPKMLAKYLLRNEPKYTDQVIDSLMHLNKEVQVRLKQPVPVFIGYFTAFVNTQNGMLNFRKDIYGHDPQVLSWLAKK